MSIRRRLLVGILCLLAAALLIANFAIYRFLSAFLYGRVDDQLESAMWAAPRLLELTEAPQDSALLRRGFPGTSFPAGTYFAYLDEDGTVVRDYVTSLGRDVAAPLRRPQVGPPRIPPNLPGGMRGGDVPSLRMTVGAVEGPTQYRLLADALTDGGTVLAAIPLTNPNSTLRRLVLVEGGVTVILLVAVGLLGFFVVRRGLRPLDRIADAAGRIAEGELSARVQPSDPRTEVGRLGLALNTMLTQIETAFRERQESEDRLRRFVADASHELRTPLTSIQGYAELFRRGASERPEDLAKVMRQIENESRRVAELVDELLLLARLDQRDPSGSPIELNRVDLTTIVAEAVEAARDLDPERRIQLSVRGPVIVRGDDVRLRQVADNLLSNARRHTPAGTLVRVSVVAEGDLAAMEVVDDGPGISAEDAERIFERFYRVDRSRSRQLGGVGLGLSIVAAIAEAHGGRARCEPLSPRGVRFRVELPLGERAEVVAERPPGDVPSKAAPR